MLCMNLGEGGTRQTVTGFSLFSFWAKEVDFFLKFELNILVIQCINIKFFLDLFAIFTKVLVHFYLKTLIFLTCKS